MNVAAQRPPRAGVKTRKPTFAEAKVIDDGLAYLSMVSAFFAAILYGDMEIAYTDDVPLAATDARHVFVNVPAMKAENWDVENVAFVEAHEVLHFVLADLVLAMGWRESMTVTLAGGKTLPYDHDLMNKAMDYRINAILIDGKIGKMPSIGLYDKAISEKGMELCVEIYEKLYKAGGGRCPPPPVGPTQPGQKGNNPGHGGFDQHLEPTEADVQAEKNGTGEPRRGLSIAAALEATKGQGELPAALKRLINEVLEPKTKWQDHLAATMRRASGEPKHDWSKVNKRMITRPVGGKIVFARRENYGCGTVVIGWDTSGSTVAWQDRFFAEMGGIVADLNPKELIVIRCDAKVHGFDTLDEPTDLDQFRNQVNDEGVGGGGGTSFKPVFEAIAEHHIEPDMVVYLTDMLGSFPDSEPDYPVIWANIRPDLKTKMPFGHMVEIEGDD